MGVYQYVIPNKQSGCVCLLGVVQSADRRVGPPRKIFNWGWDPVEILTVGFWVGRVPGTGWTSIADPKPIVLGLLKATQATLLELL